MLLSAHTNGEDVAFATAKLRQKLTDVRPDGLHPRLRVLLEVAGRKALDHAVGLRGRCQNLPGLHLERDGLGTLGSAVDAEDQGSHGSRRLRRAEALRLGNDVLEIMAILAVGVRPGMFLSCRRMSK